MASYVSEATQFINQYKKDHPDTEKRQREVVCSYGIKK
ncbi:hypothetical protein OURE66S_00662 [Oligella ureolytica]